MEKSTLTITKAGNANLKTEEMDELKWEETEHQHEWRIIPSFYELESSKERFYVFYCVHCLKSITKRVTLLK